MKLHFKAFGTGKPVLILHGLFGSLDNWQSIAKELAVQFRVFIIDQRNHGKSPHSDQHNYTLMANDLAEFCRNHRLENMVVIGHSMGGKTAMQFAIDHPGLCGKFISVDMATKEYYGGHEAIFDAMFSLDLGNLKSRQEAHERLFLKIADENIVLFLLKNLQRQVEGGFSWKMNLAVLHRNYHHITAGIATNFPVSIPCLFVKGENSGYVLPKDENDILKLFPLARFATVNIAGHWVHVENAKGLLQVLKGFL